MQPSSTILGLALAFGASVCWCGANVAMQRAGRAIGPVRALLWAQVAGGAGALLFAPWVDTRAAAPIASLVGWAAIAGVSALVAYASMFFAFARAPLSLAVPIMSSWAVVSAAIGVLVFGETLRRGQIGGAALVVAGVVLVSLRTSSAPTTESIATTATLEPIQATEATDVGEAVARLTPGALAACFGAALGFGLMVPAIHHLAPAVGRIGAIPLVYALDIALGAPIALALRLDLSWPSRGVWPVVLAAGLFETVGFACLSLSTLYAPVAIVSPLASVSAPLTALGAWLLLGERPGAVALVGALLAASGVVLLAT